MDRINRIDKLAATIPEILKQDVQPILDILDYIPFIIYVSSTDTYKIIYANKASKDLFGDDIVGKNCFSVFHNNIAPCDFCTNEQIKNGPYKWYFYNNKVDKKYLIVDQLIKWPTNGNVRLEVAVELPE
jgi:hypothetical protein